MEKNVEVNVEVEKFVKQVKKGKNVSATKSLEKIFQEKCATKIQNVLKSK